MSVDIHAALERTLDDRRLSRSERRALTEHLGEIPLDGNLVAFHLNKAFELARSRISDVPSQELVEWLEDVVKTFRAAESRIAARPEGYAAAFFSPGPSCLEEIRRQLRRAQASLRICVFTITDDRISSEILEAAGRGVQIRIITDDEKALDAGSDIQRFRERGIAVRMDASPYHMHHKYAVVDGTVLVNGSYNWTRSAAEVNEENLTVTDDARLVGPFIEAFEKLWSRLTPP